MTGPWRLSITAYPSLNLLTCHRLILQPPLWATDDDQDNAPSGDMPKKYQRNFLIPSIEVPVFVILTNLTDRILGKDYANTNGFRTFFENLANEPWEYDTDQLSENLVIHPYNGSLYFNFARSSGLSFWWSFAYATLGSFLFELGGENQAPSVNDQVLTPVGGSFLGEILYRSSVLVLQTDDESPGFWRELSAFIIAPTAGFNRLLFGDRYRTREFDEHPPVFFLTWAGAGYAWTRNPSVEGGNFSGSAAMAHAQIDYGQPADTQFEPRPFNYFQLDGALAADREALRETILIRGLLAGWRHDTSSFRGVWGIYGNYDDLAGGVFRVAGTSLGLGVVGQFDWPRSVSLKATAVASATLMGAVSTTVPRIDNFGYHLGPGAQLELYLRFYLAQRSMIDLQTAGYYVEGNRNYRGRDFIAYSRLSAFLRLLGPHALNLNASFAGRIARNRDSPNYYSQNYVTVTAGYAFIPDPRFGAAPAKERVEPADSRPDGDHPPASSEPDATPLKPPVIHVSDHRTDDWSFSRANQPW